ncbi:MAG: nucleotidyltransferase domain-containing protein [Candidatus Woesearchaeota archaeon]
MVNIYKLKLTILQQEILRLLFIKAGKTLNQRQIAKYLDVSPPAVIKALPKLEKENLITMQQDKESKRWSIEIKREKKALELKRADNLKQVYESGLSDHLENELPGGTMILFGSYSRGDDTITSDIDLAVIGRKEKTLYLEKYEKLLERTININFYKSWKDININLKNNILNGILIEGSVEL